MGENTLSPEKSIDFKATISKPKETKPPKSSNGTPLVEGEDISHYSEHESSSQKYIVSPEKGKIIQHRSADV